MPLNLCLPSARGEVTAVDLVHAAANPIVSLGRATDQQVDEIRCNRGRGKGAADHWGQSGIASTGSGCLLWPQLTVHLTVRCVKLV